MSVTPDDVRRIAALARLGVDGGRADALANELSGILAHMEVLRAVPLDEASGIASRDGARLRDDAGPSVPLAAPIEDFAPAVHDRFFVVPRLSSHEGEGHA